MTILWSFLICQRAVLLNTEVRVSVQKLLDSDSKPKAIAPEF
ncbi:hypothetical protein [Pseudanabaena sp. PCC 6802]|nr:hypothetical protein [Pseudanabaena sp. PCC 6802]